MKKILSLVLALALMLSALVISTASAADDGFVDGKFTETRHITVEIFNRNNDGGTDPTNNKWTEWIKQQMLDLYNVEVEYKSVVRFPENEMIGPLLADHDAADVSYTYNSGAVQSYAAMVDNDGQSGILDLAPLVEEYKDYLGDLVILENGIENLYYAQDPGTKALYWFEGVRAETARITTFIRKDWLDKLELPLPTTEEEFYNCLVAFRDNAEKLLGENADKMIPYTTSTDIGWRNDLMSSSHVAEDVSDETLFVYGFDDRHLLYPGYKEGIRVLNKWYNEGLIWKDFALYNDSAVEDDNMKAGYVGAFQHNWDYPFRNTEDSINANLARNVGPEAMFVAVDCFPNNAGITRKFLGAAIGSDRKIFLPATNKEPLASLLYINFISKVDTIKFLQTGNEGVNHILHEDGAYEIVKATDNDWLQNSGMNIDYTMTCNGLYLGEATAVSTALNYPGIPADVVMKANEYGKNNGRFPLHYNVGTIEAELELGASLGSKRDEILTKAVTASIEDFDKVFDEGMEDYLNMGGQDIIDERIEKLESFYGIKYEK